MQYLISFLEGIITFISPCLLQILPIYMSYFAGGGERTTAKTLKNASGFVLGFSVVFVALGALAGNLLPLRLVSAFSVALYGMFLAIFIPPARKNKVILGIVMLCFALSGLASYLPATADISEGTRTIILTVVISAGAAILFPRKNEEEATAHE